MSRLSENRAILQILTEMVEIYPDLRFGQLMRAIDVIDETKSEHGAPIWRNEFYLESSELLKRIANNPLVKGSQ